MFPIRDLNPTRGFAFVTIALILVNVAVFFFWQPFGQGSEAEVEFLYERAAIACEISEGRPLTVDDLSAGTCIEGSGGEQFFPDKNVWLAVMTSLFLHANLVHLLGNMWFLWIFGDNVEHRLNSLLFLVVYLLAGALATAGFVLLRPGEVIPLIGASGAVAGVLGAYLVFFPSRRVLAAAGLILLPVPAVIFIGLWFVAQFFVGDTGVAWEAHVAGLIAAAVLALATRPFLGSARLR